MIDLDNLIIPSYLIHPNASAPSGLLVSWWARSSVFGRSRGQNLGRWRTIVPHGDAGGAVGRWMGAVVRCYQLQALRMGHLTMTWLCCMRVLMLRIYGQVAHLTIATSLKGGP